ncbi:hypothetical protein WN943_021602 [Citrus x changshan-huyou]
MLDLHEAEKISERRLLVSIGCGKRVRPNCAEYGKVPSIERFDGSGNTHSRNKWRENTRTRWRRFEELDFRCQLATYATCVLQVAGYQNLHAIELRRLAVSNFGFTSQPQGEVKAFPQDVSRDFVDPTLEAEVAMSWWSMCPDLTCDVGHRVRILQLFSFDFYLKLFGQALRRFGLITNYTGFGIGLEKLRLTPQFANPNREYIMC